MSSPTLSTQLSDLSNKLLVYYLTPLYVFGMLGNIFNVIIFLRRTLRINSCSQYFIALSFSQIILFNSSAIHRIITYQMGYDLSRTIAILCKIRIYIYIFGVGLMRQFICLISIDRWIVSTKTARIRRFSSPGIVFWLIISSSLFWILYGIHALIGFDTSRTLGCTFVLNPDYALFYAIQITVSSFIPFIVMVVFSILTLYNVRGRQRIRILAQTTRSTPGTISNLPQNINRRQREMQLIKLSIIQVIFYVLLNMTATCYPLYTNLTSSQKKSSDQLAIDAFLSNISVFLFYTYSGITFVIYTLASKTFRKEFILTCKQVFIYIQQLFINGLN